MFEACGELQVTSNRATAALQIGRVVPYPKTGATGVLVGQDDPTPCSRRNSVYEDDFNVDSVGRGNQHGIERDRERVCVCATIGVLSPSRAEEGADGGARRTIDSEVQHVARQMKYPRQTHDWLDTRALSNWRGERECSVCVWGRVSLAAWCRVWVLVCTLAEILPPTPKPLPHTYNGAPADCRPLQDAPCAPPEGSYQRRLSAWPLMQLLCRQAPRHGQSTSYGGARTTSLC